MNSDKTDEQVAHRKSWIDIVKTICMVSVYLCHSETYGSGEVILGRLVHPFYVNAFFFVSGYLFFKKNLSVETLSNINGGGYTKRLKNIAFHLIIPTLLFSTLIYLPKTLFHGGHLDFHQFAISILGGISFWFTSAMAITQIVLLSLIFAFKQKTIWLYTVASVVLFFLGWYLNSLHSGNAPTDFFPWFYQTGLQYTLIMSLGGIYNYHEKSIDTFMKYAIIPILAIYTLILVKEWNTEIQPLYMGLGGKSNFVGFIGMLCGISLVIALCKTIRPTKWLTYIGQNSIILYFFSGVIPAFVGTIILRLFDKTYTATLLITIISTVLSIVTSYTINKYLPFMIDLRKYKR